MKPLPLLALCAALAGAAGLTAAEPRQKNAHTAKSDILKTAATAGQFKTLLTLVIAAELDEPLRGDGPFTVFAPTDDAFAKLPKGTVDKLLQPENKEQLRAILSLHVIPNKARFNFDAAEKGETYDFKTLGGTTVTIARSGDAIRVNEAKIVKPNVACRNGSVQVIDAVLLPSAAANTIPVVAEKAGTFKTLLAALTAAELAGVLAGDGPFTVFAPTDDAFARLPKGTVETLLKPENRDQLVGILKYHVVAGKKSARDLVSDGRAKTLQAAAVAVGIVDGRVTINQATVVKSDVPADNGVIHVIDRVLTPGQ